MIQHSAKVQTGITRAHAKAPGPQATGQRVLASRFLRCLSTQPCEPSEPSSRKRARYPRGAGVRACVHRSQVAESFSRICLLSKEPATSKHTIRLRAAQAQTSNKCTLLRQGAAYAVGGDDPPADVHFHECLGCPRRTRAWLGHGHRAGRRGGLKAPLKCRGDTHAAAAAPPTWPPRAPRAPGFRPPSSSSKSGSMP